MAKLNNIKEKQMIFTTKLVDESSDKLNDGVVLKRYQNPWFKNEIGIRRSGVTFRMTDAEQEEYIKCALDIYYFVEKYCLVKTEDGAVDHINFDGRDYQKEILSNLVNNRFNIIMSSRQSGKCVSFNSLCIFDMDGVEKQMRIGKLYYYIISLQRQLTIFEKIKIKLYDFLYYFEK